MSAVYSSNRGANNLRERSSPASVPVPALNSNGNHRNHGTRLIPEPDARTPLLPNTPTAPLAGIETLDNDSDDREVVTAPYPGVDDGFFHAADDEGKNGDPEVENFDPKMPDDGEVERVPKRPEVEPLEPPTEIPELTPRVGPDGGDESDGKPASERPRSPSIPAFPYAPGFWGWGWRPRDPELGGGGDVDSIPDVNVYQHKKTLAQGMMDLALFSANANQLRYVLESYERHPYYLPSMVLISISLMLQVAVGMGLIWNATYNVKNEKEICIANKISNFTIIGIFLVTVVNVFISAFGVANPAKT